MRTLIGIGPLPKQVTGPHGQDEFGVDQCVKAFEAAWESAGRPALEDFLPPSDNPNYSPAVCELVRVDLEFGWGAGRPRSLDDYCRTFPAVFRDAATLSLVAYEEFRQRQSHGQEPTPTEYARKYGVNTADWPLAEPPGTIEIDGAAGLEAASRIYRQCRGERGDLETAAAPGVAGDALDMFRAIHEVDPAAARRLADGTLELPSVGETFQGFRLEAELGRGAFGRVFLARQAGLAHRLVALKVTAPETYGAMPADEAQTLAQLQHTNIVPIHSVHNAGPLRAVCMPYFGPTTLADVIRGLRDSALLPASGRHLISTVNDRKLSTLRPRTHPDSGKPGSANPNAAPAENDSRPAPSTAGIAAEAPRAILERFERQSYVDAVCWLGARLADGLCHAHERGIVHRDLKPANILLSDDGQPMLLDFNLAEDAGLRSSASAARIGGTLPYMSPEQLAAFAAQGVAGPPSAVDARTDIYSLGLILFELLTGRAAFPHRPGPLQDSIKLMLADRRQPPPRLTRANPNVTPAVEAIVRRCLEPNPDRRYQSARAVTEDIERHLNNQPLRHTREPSIRERARKWVRRHPRLASWTTAGIVTAAALFGLAGWAFVHGRELQRLTAEKQAAGFESARNAQQALLNSVLNSASRGELRQSADMARDALAAYGVLDNPNWRGGPLVAPLPPADQKRLIDHIGEMLLTWAEAEHRWSEGAKGRERPEALARAWRLTEEAAACLNDGGENLAVWRQKAVLAGAIGRNDVEAIVETADRMTPRTSDDHYYLGRALARRHELKKAIGHLLKATELEPTRFWARINLGSCYYDLGDIAQAVAAYGMCVGLARDPAQEYYAYYHRGMVFRAQGAHVAAIADLERAVERLPSLPADLARSERPKLSLLLAEVLRDRGKLLSKPADFAAAEKVLTDALDADGEVLRLYLLRAEVRALRGDKAGAGRDWQAALKVEPVDERDWTFRGLARLEQGDAAGALADFERALQLNATFYLALQNKAHVLSVKQGKDAESLAVLNRLVDLYPDFVKARIGRGVLLARQGKRLEAHADAVESLARDRSGETLYMAANIYALTVKQEPADARRSHALLAAALLNGFGFDDVDGDADMEMVRAQPWYKQVVETGRAIRKDVSSRSPIE
jgi:serine/threonine protein kinase